MTEAEIASGAATGVTLIAVIALIWGLAAFDEWLRSKSDDGRPG